MAFSSARKSNFEIDNSAASLTDISAYCDTSDLDQKLAALDTTTFGDGAKTFVAGLSDGAISLGGPWDATLDATLAGTVAALAAGTNASASFQYGPTGTATGGIKYTGECLITDYKVSSAVAGIIKWTASMQITGAVTRGTF